MNHIVFVPRSLLWVGFLILPPLPFLALAQKSVELLPSCFFHCLIIYISDNLMSEERASPASDEVITPPNYILSVRGLNVILCRVAGK